MAKVHGRNMRVLLGRYDQSDQYNSATPSRQTELADVTTFTDTGHRWLPGLKNGTLALEGFFDALRVDAEIQPSLGAAAVAVVTVGPDGLANGKAVMLLETRTASYEVTGAVDDVVGVSVELQSNDDGIAKGVSLKALAAVSGTEDGTAVDNGASSGNGGTGHLHVTANTRDGGIVVKIQHSVDNLSFVDLITFTSIPATTPTAERLKATGTVNRYVRHQVASVGGTTGSATIAVAFSRS